LGTGEELPSSTGVSSGGIDAFQTTGQSSSSWRVDIEASAGAVDGVASNVDYIETGAGSGRTGEIDHIASVASSDAGLSDV